MYGLGLGLFIYILASAKVFARRNGNLSIMVENVCLIFDLDDTLVDSETLSNQAFLDLIPELSLSLLQLTERNRGRKLTEILIDLQAEIGRSIPQSFVLIYRERVAALFQDKLKATPFVKEVLAKLPYSFCVASSGPMAKIRQALRVTHLDEFFGDNVFSSYEINSWKPAPDIFQHAATMMGVRSSNCLVIEDSLPGIEAALAANMKVLQFQGAKRAQLRSDVPGFTDMRQLPDLIEYQFRA